MFVAVLSCGRVASERCVLGTAVSEAPHLVLTAAYLTGGRHDGSLRKCGALASRTPLAWGIQVRIPAPEARALPGQKRYMLVAQPDFIPSKRIAVWKQAHQQRRTQNST